MYYTPTWMIHSLSGSDTSKADGSEPVNKPPFGVVDGRVQHMPVIRLRTNLAGGLSLLLEAVEELDDGV